MLLLFSLQSVWAQSENNDSTQTTNVSEQKSREEIIDSLVNREYKPSTRPTYTPHDRYGDPYSNRGSKSSLYLKNPSNLQLEYDVDRDGNFTIREKIGRSSFRPETSYSYDELEKLKSKETQKDYYKEAAIAEDGESAVSGRRLLPKIYLSPGLDRIFGGDHIDIVPNGFVNFDIGGRWQRRDNPDVPVGLRKTGAINYDQQMGISLNGKIGEKLTITANYDNNNTFDFQNNLKVDYQGLPEDIIKDIEIGNVSLPVSNSLIRGGTALFGLKTKLQFGKLFVTGVLSRQRGTNNCITSRGRGSGNRSSRGSGEEKEIELLASEYEQNKYFFMGHYFRDNYEKWMSNLPGIRSQLVIREQEVEVYILSTNRSTNTEARRKAIAFTDLGEGDPDNILNEALKAGAAGAGSAANNNANPLWEEIFENPAYRNLETGVQLLQDNFGMEEGRDYTKLENARKLTFDEYDIDPLLGIISLRSALSSDQALAISYKYTHNLRNVSAVGELGNDAGDQDVIFLKLLRPQGINTAIPSWDLMMKNVYSIGSRNVNQDDFELTIHYREDAVDQEPIFLQGVSSELASTTLIELMGMDRLNLNLDFGSDGLFDFLEGELIDQKNGIVRFPVLEPFGSHLESLLLPEDEAQIPRLVYNELYEQIRESAHNVSEKNKFKLRIRYTGGSAIFAQNSSASAAATGTRAPIQLNAFQISEGSISVTANGQLLTEGTHYMVDYFGGQVRITDGRYIDSDIEVCFEQADLFNLQTRWLSGARFDYKLSDDINFGATFMQLKERPGGISTYAIGEEPTNNFKYGLDLSVKKDSRLITKIVDALPLLSTKEKSSISINTEFAQLVPGTTNQVNGQGTGYVDDFENFALAQGLGNAESWRLGSTPRLSDDRFGATRDGKEPGYRRAKIAWFETDPSFLNNPDLGVTNGELNVYERFFPPNVIFSQRQFNALNANAPISFLNLAYFPKERGQYNYNPDAEQFSDFLPEPERNYGAITRGIRLNSWTQNNVEYIEFWILDPNLQDERREAFPDFDPNEVDPAPKLVINVGDVSEDLAPDNRRAFENNLPINYEINESTELQTWGIIPELTVVPPNINAFSTSGDQRANQDIGLDGLKSEDEGRLFDNAVFNGAAESLRQDPSSDDFTHYLDPSFGGESSIISRYKDFNGMEGNATETNSDIQGSRFADVEDINGDANVDQRENYFGYDINLDPANLNEANEFIFDSKTLTIDGRQTTWYQFRIPVRKFTHTFGSPSFDNIRFVRMYLTGYRNPVMIRLAKFQFVGSDWWVYREETTRSGLNIKEELEIDNVSVDAVNIEENGRPSEGADPNQIYYTVPPGIERNRNTSTGTTLLENEQALRVRVTDLENGEFRAAFRAYDKNLVNYGRIQMYLHAENVPGSNVEDDEVSAFLRLGTDRRNHYYEVEVPLKLTKEPTADARLIWPEENEIDIQITDLYRAKVRRNDVGFPQVSDYVTQSEDGRHIIRVKGNPRISEINTIMIGVRNRDSTEYRSVDNKFRLVGDDGADKSIVIWANELRVSDFDTKSGWAAKADIAIKLADFADVKGGLSYTSSGYGGLEQNISERTDRDVLNYNVSASINVDKLIPGKHGVKIPLYVATTQNIETPRWDPYNEDIPLEESLSQKEDTEAETYKELVQGRESTRTITLNGLKKTYVKEDANRDIWDIENFSFSYGYSESRRSNSDIKEHTIKNYNGGVNWSYSPGGVSIEPFKNVKFLEGKFLQLIKDINFSPLPSSITFSGTFDRKIEKRQIYRGANFFAPDPIYSGWFNLNRSYNVSWPLTKNLSATYTANARGVIDTPDEENTKEYKRDSIIAGLRRLGRMKNFTQNLVGTYKVPFDKFPLTNWLTSTVNYSSGYTWTAQNNISRVNSPEDDLGNSIANDRKRSVTGGIKLLELYNKVPFLKAINQPKKKPSGGRPPEAKADTLKRDRANSALWLPKKILRLAMAFRDLDASYSITEGLSLYGFRPTAGFFGLDNDVMNAPGIEFSLLGSQDGDIRWRAAENGWLVRNTNIQQFGQNFTRDLSLKSSAEPFNDLKISLTAKRQHTSQFSSFFVYDFINPEDTTMGSEFQDLSPARSGSYTVSFNSIRTAFMFDEGNDVSPVFEKFRENISVVADRLRTLNPDGEINQLDQNVVIPAFIAAYSGESANSVRMTAFPRVPIPNWRLDYSGLMKVPKIKEIFSSFSVSHSYNSTYSIGSYVISQQADDTSSQAAARFEVPGLNEDLTNPRFLGVDANGNSILNISQVSIKESFSPLIGINVRTKSDITARFEYKRSRDLSLQINNRQVTEMRNSDFVFDFGFIKDGMRLPFRTKGKVITLKNDLNFKVSLTLRDTKTLQRVLAEADDNTPNANSGDLISLPTTTTNGSFNWTLKPTISYVLSNTLSLSMYFDRNVNVYYVSTQTPLRTSAFGFQLRWSLSQ